MAMPSAAFLGACDYQVPREEAAGSSAQALASENGIDWNSAGWNAVNWNAANWNAVNWNAANWNAINWNAANWNLANWNGANWNAINWNAANWNAVNWNAANWNAANWNAANWNAVNWNAANWNGADLNAANWNAVNWNSVNWNAVNWNSVQWNFPAEIAVSSTSWPIAIWMTGNAGGTAVGAFVVVNPVLRDWVASSTTEAMRAARLGFLRKIAIWGAPKGAPVVYDASNVWTGQYGLAPSMFGPGPYVEAQAELLSAALLANFNDGPLMVSFSTYANAALAPRSSSESYNYQLLDVVAFGNLFRPNATGALDLYMGGSGLMAERAYSYYCSWERFSMNPPAPGSVYDCNGLKYLNMARKDYSRWYPDYHSLAASCVEDSRWWTEKGPYAGSSSDKGVKSCQAWDPSQRTYNHVFQVHVAFDYRTCAVPDQCDWEPYNSEYLPPWTPNYTAPWHTTLYPAITDPMDGTAIPAGFSSYGSYSSASFAGGVGKFTAGKLHTRMFSWDGAGKVKFTFRVRGSGFAPGAALRLRSQNVGECPSAVIMGAGGTAPTSTWTDVSLTCTRPKGTVYVEASGTLTAEVDWIKVEEVYAAGP